MTIWKVYQLKIIIYLFFSVPDGSCGRDVGVTEVSEENDLQANQMWLLPHQLG